MNSTFYGRISRNRVFLLGLSLCLLMLTAMIFSLFISPEEYEKISIINRFKPPSKHFWLGTDQLGRDIFSMLAIGARNTVLIALFSVGFGLIIGLPAGLLAASSRKKLDFLISSTGDFIFAFPSLIIAIILASVYGPGAFVAIIAIGIFNISVFTRIIRNAALPIFGRDYVLISKTFGKNNLQIILSHVLPNISHVIAVQVSIQLSTAILAEAALSYLGLSVRPPSPTWGKMLYDSQTFFQKEPMLVIYPGLLIILGVLGFNLLGDGLRDLLDPKSSMRK